MKPFFFRNIWTHYANLSIDRCIWGQPVSSCSFHTVSCWKESGGKGRKSFVQLKWEWWSTHMRVQRCGKGNIRHMSTKQGASKCMCVWVRAAFKSGKLVYPCLHPWVIWRQNNMHYDNPITRQNWQQKDSKSVKAAGSWHITWQHSNTCTHTNNNRKNKNRKKNIVWKGDED